MSASTFGSSLDSLTFGVESTIGYYDLSDEAVIEEKVGFQNDEAGCANGGSKTWIYGDALGKRLLSLVRQSADR
jgi:hypothetical protein